MNTPNATKPTRRGGHPSPMRETRVAATCRALAPLVRQWIERDREAVVKMEGWKRHHDESELGAAHRALLGASDALQAAVVRRRTARAGRPLSPVETKRLSEHRAFERAAATWRALQSEHVTPDEYVDHFAALADASDLSRRVARHARTLARAAGPDHPMAADLVALQFAAEDFDAQALGASCPLLVARLAAAPMPGVVDRADPPFKVRASNADATVAPWEAMEMLLPALRTLEAWEEKYPKVVGDKAEDREDRAAALTNFRNCAKHAGRSPLWQRIRKARREDGRFSWIELQAIRDWHAGLKATSHAVRVASA